MDARFASRGYRRLSNQSHCSTYPVAMSLVCHSCWGETVEGTEYATMEAGSFNRSDDKYLE